jgi:hypothetical protein
VANWFRLRRTSGPSAPDAEPAESPVDRAADAVAEVEVEVEVEGGETETPEPERPYELDVTGLLVAVAYPEAPAREETDGTGRCGEPDTEVAPPQTEGPLEMESLLKAVASPADGGAAPPELGPTPAEPDAWWHVDTAGNLVPRAELPNEPLAALARSATAGLGALVASPLSVHEYAEDVFARTVSLTVRDDSSDYAWRIDAAWTDSDGRRELLEALAAMFGEPVPIVGLRRLRSRGDIRSGVAQTPTLHLSAPNVGGPEPDWERVLASVVPGDRIELDEDDVRYRGVRIHGMAVACAVDNDVALARVDRWLGCLLAAAAGAD